MKGFWIGLAVGVAGGVAVTGGGAIYLFNRHENQPLIFPQKQFYDNNPDASAIAYVKVSGTVTGTADDRLGFPNNHISMECWRQRGECDVMDYTQIAPRQLSDVTLERWTIERWTPDLIVVLSNPTPTGCYRVRVNIMRRTKVVQYFREPQIQNAAQPRCRESEMRLSRWTIEDPPWWRDRAAPSR